MHLLCFYIKIAAYMEMVNGTQVHVIQNQSDKLKGEAVITMYSLMYLNLFK